MDSQSIKTATQATEVGFDGGKQVKGRKRHLLVDTLGLLIAVVVTAANTDDRVGHGPLNAVFCGWRQALTQTLGRWGLSSGEVSQWVRDVKHTHKIDLEVTSHEGKGFQVVPWRWVVERTFAWLLNDRRHSRDYERLTTNSEAMIQLSMIRLLLNGWRDEFFNSFLALLGARPSGAFRRAERPLQEGETIMKHLPIIITLLISGLWIHTVNAESPAPERLQTLRVTGMIVPYETQPRDTFRTVSILVNDKPWLFRISDAETLTDSGEVVPDTMKDESLLKDIRFTGPDALMRRLQKANQMGRSLTY